MKQNCSLLIQDCAAVLSDFTVLYDSAIAIDADKIIEIGNCADLCEKYAPAAVVNGKYKLAMPGMYDCHTHTVQQLLKGGTIDEPPIVWRRILVPYESKMNDEDRYQAARLYCLQALKAGITMFADAGSMDMTGTVRAVEETGIRAAIARVGRDWDEGLPDSMCDRRAIDVVKKSEALYKQYNGAANGKISIWFSLSSPMSVTEELARMVAEAAKEYKTGIHIHMGEHPAEVQHCLTHYKRRPPQWLYDCGVLGPNLIAAHCIQITDYDMRLMAQSGMHVIHCPSANLTTQGIPKLLAERAAGVNLALGNDGASNAKQDLFFQMQLMKYVTQAVYGTPVFEPVVLPLQEMFNMATINGARALGVGHMLGSLEAGKKADIVLLNIKEPNFLPTRDLMKTVMMVASAQDVSDVVVDGELLLKDRAFTKLDEEAILREGMAQCEKLIRRA